MATMKFPIAWRDTNILETGTIFKKLLNLKGEMHKNIKLIDYNMDIQNIFFFWSIKKILNIINLDFPG